MKALLLALVLVSGQAWGAFAQNTTMLLNFEADSLVDTTAQNNGTVLSALTYGTTAPWNGLKNAGGGGYFSIPVGTLSGGSGCIEFSLTGAGGPAGIVFSINTGGGARILDFYHNADLYAYSSTAGVNNIVQAGIAGKKWYVKTTWNGTTWKVYIGEWSTAGTVTLAEVGSFVSPDMTTPTAIGVCGSVTAGIPTNGYVDWVRTRNVYDPTTTVTVDPVASTLQPLSPYMSNSLSNFKFPLWFLK